MVTNLMVQMTWQHSYCSKYQVRGKCYACHTASWIVSCQKVGNSTNLQTNCEATSLMEEINSLHDHEICHHLVPFF